MPGVPYGLKVWWVNLKVSRGRGGQAGVGGSRRR